MTCGNTTLDGSTANSFTGKIHFDTETDTPDYQQLRLAKTGGAQAIAGDLELGGNANVVWKEDNQISEKSRITLAGGRLSPDGHTNKLGKLIVTGPAYIDLDGGDGKLLFADSSQEKWKAGGQLLIAHWKEKGKAGVYVGNSPSGLSAEQIKNIGFENPAGMDAGVYHAELSDSGELLPTREMIQAINPPFDLSASAQAARKAIYDVHGLEHLTGAGTPLKKGMKISIFGDSITWLNGYISAMDDALAKGAGTHDLGVQIFNHGVNGGGVLQIRDASDGAAFDGKENKAHQASFADVISADHTDIAVVYIGINDVTWRNTKPEDFEKAMKDIADTAKAHGVHLVLVTLSVHNEKPDGSNSDDKKIEQFAQITRDVAASSGATLVDLRKAYIAYLQNNNWKLQLDGSLSYQTVGVLTGDGIHPSEAGVKMLSENIAEGIYQCLTNSKAPQ
jgi:lysophospholipase L1-like esterase